MSKEIMTILEKLDKGKISPQNAVESIRNHDFNEAKPKRCASKVKITVISKKEGKSIKLPSIPFWVITSLGNLAIKLTPLGLKYSSTLDDESKKYINHLKDLDLREIFDVLSSHEPCDLVHVIDDEDGDEVKITIL